MKMKNRFKKNIEGDNTEREESDEAHSSKEHHQAVHMIGIRGLRLQKIGPRTRLQYHAKGKHKRKSCNSLLGMGFLGRYDEGEQNGGLRDDVCLNYMIGFLLISIFMNIMLNHGNIPFSDQAR